MLQSSLVFFFLLRLHRLDEPLPWCITGRTPLGGKPILPDISSLVVGWSAQVSPLVQHPCRDDMVVVGGCHGGR